MYLHMHIVPTYIYIRLNGLNLSDVMQIVILNQPTNKRENHTAEISTCNSNQVLRKQVRVCHAVILHSTLVNQYKAE